MSEVPKIGLKGGEVKVVDLATGEEVFRPDVAEKAMRVFGAAIEAAGGTFEAPDNVVELFAGHRPDDTEPGSLPVD